jgi:hypothetical protein
MKKFTGTFLGHMPWVMTQNQRGPTCGLTAINVAYRILTGWTLFATKGQYRDFNILQYQRVVKKGEEHAYVLRKAAKDLNYTAAGEIVNADDLADLANLCDGIRAEVIVTGDGDGGNFMESIRRDIKAGGIPLVLFYVIPDQQWIKHTPSRQGTFQHWVPIYAVENFLRWLNPRMTSINGNCLLNVSGKERAENDQLMMWSWGQAWVTDGVNLGKSSALSLDWLGGSPRKWIKNICHENIGKLKWSETLPSNNEYSTVPTKTTQVRNTSRIPNRNLALRGYVNLTRS